MDDMRESCKLLVKTQRAWVAVLGASGTREPRPRSRSQTLTRLLLTSVREGERETISTSSLCEDGLKITYQDP